MTKRRLKSTTSLSVHVELVRILTVGFIEALVVQITTRKESSFDNVFQSFLASIP